MGWGASALNEGKVKNFNKYFYVSLHISSSCSRTRAVFIDMTRACARIRASSTCFVQISITNEVREILIQATIKPHFSGISEIIRQKLRQYSTPLDEWNANRQFFRSSRHREKAILFIRKHKRYRDNCFSPSEHSAHMRSNRINNNKTSATNIRSYLFPLSTVSKPAGSGNQFHLCQIMKHYLYEFGKEPSSLHQSSFKSTRDQKPIMGECTNTVGVRRDHLCCIQIKIGIQTPEHKAEVR